MSSATGSPPNWLLNRSLPNPFQANFLLDVVAAGLALELNGFFPFVQPVVVPFPNTSNLCHDALFEFEPIRNLAIRKPSFSLTGGKMFVDIHLNGVAKFQNPIRYFR